MFRMVVVTFSMLPHSSLLNFFGFVILGYIFHHWQHSCIDSFFSGFFKDQVMVVPYDDVLDRLV